MTTVFHEHPRSGDFLLSEANGSYSRENELLAQGQTLDAGTVLGKITATGKFTQLAPAATDGSKDPAGILIARADAEDGDLAVVVLSRAAEVKADALIWPDPITTAQQTTAITKLAALGIVLR